MDMDYDWDIYEVFLEQLLLQLPQIELEILALERDENRVDALDTLFRFFHTYKATSAYLTLTPITELVSKVETVLSVLRERDGKVQESIVEWLLQAKEQLLLYTQEMEHNNTQLSPLPKDFLNSLEITSSYISPKEKLKTLHILYMDQKESRAQKLLPFLRKIAGKVSYAKEDQNNHTLNFKPYDLVITNLNQENYAVIDFIGQNYKHLPILAIFDELNTLEYKKLLEKGVGHTLQNPLSAKALERELLSLSNLYFTSSNILIEHKKIISFIKTLKPLPNTIFQIVQICDDEEIPVKELIKVVKSDPIIAANILKVANSPIYTAQEIKTIDQAVTKFGKRSIKALTMSGLYKSLGSIDLSAYNITEEDFSTIAMQRMALMIKWYAKVSVADLSILSTTALLSNIGQLLLSKEILAIHQEDRFEEIYKTFGIEYAEESLLHTTTSHVSAQILRYWKLDPDVVSVIEYSTKIEEAPQELQKLCVANAVVSELIPLSGALKREIPDSLLLLLSKYNLDPAPLQKALAAL